MVSKDSLQEVGYTTAWSQRPNESEKAYHGFRTYLELETPRRLTDVAEKLGKHVSQMYQWSTKYQWLARAQQFDAWVTGQTDNARAEALVLFQGQVLMEEVSDYQKLTSVWNEMLERFVANGGFLTGNDEEAGLAPTSEEVLKQFKHLAQIRLVIDNMARKAARLPNTYRASEVKSDGGRAEDEIIMLSYDNGPMRLPEGDDG